MTSPKALWLWSALGLLCLYPVVVPGMVPANGAYDAAGYIVGRDFLNIWTASKLLLADDAARIFVRTDYLAYIRSVYGADFPVHLFVYPPHTLLFIFFFGLIPYFPALFAWTAGGMAAIAAVLRKTAPQLPWQAVLMVLLSPAAIINTLSGQNGFFTAALLLGGILLSEKKPVTAGILLGILTIKPQLGVLVPFFLLARRNWRCIAAAGVTTLALVAASTALWGLNPWLAFPDKLNYGYTLLTQFQGFYTYMLVGTYAEVRWLGVSADHADVIYGTVAWIVAIAAIAFLKQEGPTARGALVLCLATLLASPYGYNYDCVMIAAAIVLYLRENPQLRLPHALALGLLWLLPAMIYELHLYRIPLSAPLLLGTLVWQMYPFLRSTLRTALQGTAKDA